MKVPIFAKILNSPGDAKNGHIAKRVLEDVIRCLESKVDKKIPMESEIDKNKLPIGTV